MDPEVLWLMSRAQSTLVPAAKMTLSTNQTSFLSGSTIGFDSTSAQGGYANIPTLASNRLTCNLNGIWSVKLNLYVTYSGTLTSVNLALMANTGGTNNEFANTSYNISATSGWAGSISADIQMSPADYVYATLAFAGATSMVIVSCPFTFMSMTWQGTIT
ncbi:MAG: hypothetical protein KGL39_44530 [Patescibacteria group bacterium]|nr:hypothetical protein [Patescibacteria group bacterium]